MAINKRLTVTLTPEIEKEIERIKAIKEYCAVPTSELLRRLIQAGIDSDKNANPSQSA